MFNETTPSVTIMIANNTACGSTKYCFENAYIRPAISLVSDVTISSGTGSSFDPFVIIENQENGCNKYKSHKKVVLTSWIKNGLKNK